MKTPPVEDVARAGDVLDGRYKLVRVIGEGGMGTVFLAEHVLIKRRVAVKVLHTELARDQDVVERFMNEARAAGTLGHPNIVESTDMGFARNEVPFIVFEYLEGTMLSDEVYRLGGLTARRALKIANQVASALDAAHRAGIIHRDLKTDNVFLTDKEETLDHVKVLDFGISRFLEAGQDRTGRGGKTRGVMMGTPEFMAPEQIMSPESVDERTDVYALGVLLYECLAARTPFINENKADPHELLHRIVLDRPPPLEVKNLPAGLADMIHDKLLAKDPDARFQSMRDVQAAIEAFTSVMRRDSMPKIEPAIEIVSLPAPVPAVPAVRRRPWLWLVPAILAGAAGGVLAMAPPTVTHGTPATAELERDAERIASAIDATASAAALRVEGIASSPVLRAAIETDAATLEDMARDGAVIKAQPGEVIEIFQLRDGQPASLLRVPGTAAAIAPVAGSSARFASDTRGSMIVVSAPVARANGAPGGSVALAVPIDLRTLAPKVGDHAIDVRITGPGTDVVLADHEGSGVERTVPVVSKLATLSLVAVVGSPLVATQPYALVAYGCLAAAGLFLLLFLVGLVARR